MYIDHPAYDRLMSELTAATHAPTPVLDKIADGIARDLADPDVAAFVEDSNRRLGAAGPNCPTCGWPTTELVRGGQGKPSGYWCASCGKKVQP